MPASEVNAHAHLVGVDWGTTSLRAYRYDTQGQVLETRSSAQGLTAGPPGGFEQVLLDLAGDWLASDGKTPVLMCGMIGSRSGWVEAPYVVCSAGLPEIAANLVKLDTAVADARIVPGVRTAEGAEFVEVMRGEEVQVLGAVEGSAPHRVVAPGTHSKWIEVDGGAIATCATYLTGELFAVLSRHSILGQLMQGAAFDEAAFRLGVTRALREPDLLRQLFTVRTEALFARIAPEAASAYLSGLLIGTEVGSGLTRTSAAPILVVGRPEIAACYALALAAAGAADVTTVDGDQASASGLWKIHQASARR